MKDPREDIIKSIIHTKLIELFSLFKKANMRLEMVGYCGEIKCNKTHEVLGKLYDDEIVWERDLDCDLSGFFGTLRN
jgi:hypothetical protein